MIDRILSRSQEKLGSIDEDQRNEAREKLGQVLDKARAMDDVDFQLNSKDLAEELDFLDRKGQLEKELTGLVGEEDRPSENP